MNFKRIIDFVIYVYIYNLFTCATRVVNRLLLDVTSETPFEVLLFSGYLFSSMTYLFLHIVGATFH